MWHRNPQDHKFNNTRKIYHHYTVVRVVWQLNVGLCWNTSTENVEYCIRLGSMAANGEGCTLEIKARIAMAKAAFKKKEGSFYEQIGLKFKD